MKSGLFVSQEEEDFPFVPEEDAWHDAVKTPKDYMPRLYLGDVLDLHRSRFKSVIVEIENPWAWRIKVKHLGAKRTRTITIGRMSIKARDEFMSLAYKAANGIKEESASDPNWRRS